LPSPELRREEHGQEVVDEEKGGKRGRKKEGAFHCLL